MYSQISYKSHFLIICIIITIIFSGCFSNEDLKEQLPNVTKFQETTSYDTKLEKTVPYPIGRGDTLSVQVYRRSDFSQVLPIDTFIVKDDGSIFMPLVGVISVENLSALEVENIVRKQLSKELVNPIISVNVTESQSKKVLVSGEVKKPGIYAIGHNTTALEAVLSAGGFSPNSDRTLVVLIRTSPAHTVETGKESNAYAMNLKDYLEGRDFLQNALVHGGEIIYVPNDRIAKSNRFWAHVTEVIRPFAETFGVIQGLVILDRSTAE
jgi:polysaccharide export outer membrane protein